MAKVSRPIVLFLHIPRTAGTTFNRAVRVRLDSKRDIVMSPFVSHRNWREFVAYARSVPPTRNRARYFRGHFSFGIDTFLPQPSVYITMLRHPVERVISSYYFFIKQLGLSDVSLEEFVRRGREDDSRPHIRWTDNVQVRMLAGQNGEPVDVPIGSCSNDMVELAKQRIASDRFVLAGLTERLDETMLLLRKRFGWRNSYYISFNAGKARPPTREVPPAMRALIETHNALDMELYAFAKERFEEQVRAAGPGFADELERLRVVNRQLNRALAPVAQPLAWGYVRLANLLQRR